MEELEWPSEDEMRRIIEEMSIDEKKELIQVICDSLDEIQQSLIAEGNRKFSIKD